MTEPLHTPEQKTEREKLALSCAYEIEAITMHLRDNLPTELEYGHLRCMVLRILKLNSVIASVIGLDEVWATEDMRRFVEGAA